VSAAQDILSPEAVTGAAGIRCSALLHGPVESFDNPLRQLLFFGGSTPNPRGFFSRVTTQVKVAGGQLRLRLCGKLVFQRCSHNLPTPLVKVVIRGLALLGQSERTSFVAVGHALDKTELGQAIDIAGGKGAVHIGRFFRLGLANVVEVNSLGSGQCYHIFRFFTFRVPLGRVFVLNKDSLAFDARIVNTILNLFLGLETSINTRVWPCNDPSSATAALGGNKCNQSGPQPFAKAHG
jgi:hypothetical protein